MSDSDIEMLKEAPAPVKTSLEKGKGKALEEDPTEQLDVNLPWVEKYRPESLDDVVSHKEITSTIERFIEKQRLPHMLFYGPPGTGKTSTIVAVAKKIYGKGYKKQILELNASDDRGIDVVRTSIKQFAEMRTLFSAQFKLIILDEADMMTQAAQAALRRVIEQYTKNVRFCIICNYVGKITPAIQSRCTRFRFEPLPSKEVERRLEGIIENEKVDVTPEGMQALLRLTKGDMRRALNVLQASHAAFSPDPLTPEHFYTVTGQPHPQDIEKIVRSMMGDEFTTAYQVISMMRTEKGLALQDLITGVFEYVEELELAPGARCYLYDQLSNIEYRLACGSNERIQMSALLGAFKNAVELSYRAQEKGKS